MKRILNGILVFAMLFVIGCGTKQESDPNFEWTRQGNYTNDDGEYLMVSKSETEGYEGWAISYMVGEEVHGWIIQQEGNTLHGNLVAPGQEGEYIVTIKEEGEDGLLFITPDNKEHHFKRMEMPEIIATLSINTEGLGQIAYAIGDEEIEFSDEHPFQSSYVNLTEPRTYKLGAKASDGWKFVKWTLNGSDYSTDEIITVEVKENSDFVAVFEAK